MNAAFYDELAKMGAAPKRKSPKGYAASILGHELGHAQDFEGRRVPNLRKAVERGVQLGGLAGSIIGAARGKPGIAALSQVAAQAPTLIDEATASFKAVKELEKTKSFTPEEIKKMKRHLISAGATYLGQAAVSTGMAAGAAAAVRYKADPLLAVPVGHLASVAVGIPLGKLFQRMGKGTPVITERQAKALKKQMRVQAQIYKGRKNMPGTALYIPKQPGGIFHKLRVGQISNLLESKSKNKSRTAETILREGGVLLTPQSMKQKRDLQRKWSGMKKVGAKKEEKPGVLRRVAKGVGLGAVTLGVGGGIAALAAGKGGRKKAWDWAKRQVKPASLKEMRERAKKRARGSTRVDPPEPLPFRGSPGDVRRSTQDEFDRLMSSLDDVGKSRRPKPEPVKARARVIDLAPDQYEASPRVPEGRRVGPGKTKKSAAPWATLAG